MIKKVLSIALATVVAATMLVGCGSNTGDDEKKITMAIWGGERDQEVYQKRIDAFKKANPNIKVELNLIPKDYDQKVQTMIAGGTAPDVIMSAEGIHSLSQKGVLLDLTDLVKEAGLNLDERHGTVAKNYQYNGGIYGIPDRGGAQVLFYNKDMFDEAGIEYPTKDWTREQFYEAAKKLTKKNGSEIDVFGFAPSNWWAYYINFILQRGSIVENDKVTINSKENLETLKFMKELFTGNNKVAPSPRDFENFKASSGALFSQGKAAMLIDGFWFASPDIGVDWDFSPVFEGGIPFGSALCITKASKNKKDAFELIKFLTDVRGQEIIVEEKHDIPTNVAVLGNKELIGTWNPKGDKGEVRMEGIQEHVLTSLTMPYEPYWSEITRSLETVITEYFADRLTAEEALIRMEEELTIAIEKSK